MSAVAELAPRLEDLERRLAELEETPQDSIGSTNVITITPAGTVVAGGGGVETLQFHQGPHETNNTVASGPKAYGDILTFTLEEEALVLTFFKFTCARETAGEEMKIWAFLDGKEWRGRRGPIVGLQPRAFFNGFKGCQFAYMGSEAAKLDQMVSEESLANARTDWGDPIAQPLAAGEHSIELRWAGVKGHIAESNLMAVIF